jgi:hypothetical protein
MDEHWMEQPGLARGMREVARADRRLWIMRYDTGAPYSGGVHASWSLYELGDCWLLRRIHEAVQLADSDRRFVAVENVVPDKHAKWVLRRFGALSPVQLQVEPRIKDGTSYELRAVYKGDGVHLRWDCGIDEEGPHPLIGWHHGSIATLNQFLPALG